MKGLLGLAMLFFLVCNSVYSQYNTGIGLKAGKFNSGVTFKRFFHSDMTVGMQVDLCFTHIADDGITLKAFYLKQLPFTLPIWQISLDFVYGGGLHTGFFPYRTQDGGYYKIVDGQPVRYNKDVVTVGVDATLQIEYQVPSRKYPFSFGIECNPFYEFVNRGPEWIDFGLTLRYVFR